MRAMLLVVLLLLACGAPDTLVEDLQANGPTDFTLASSAGARDGSRTSARFEFVERSRRLVLEVTLAYDPQPVLVSGTWALGDVGGSVRAESVRFVGGQGEGPSVGGVYVLDSSEGSRFRVRLPLTPIGGGWSPGS